MAELGKPSPAVHQSAAGNNATKMTRRSFLEAAGVVLVGAGLLCLPGCTGGRSNSTAETSASASDESAGNAASPAQDNPAGHTSPASSIVVFFSRANENYGVGYVEVGNTAKVAAVVAEKTGADTFEIKRVQAYPSGYDACCDEAQNELNANARPPLVETIDLSPYNTVYLGYPLWWGDMPMPVYTFLESQDWSGKTIRPFATHAGSGLASSVSTLRSLCAGATVAEGMSIIGTTAQNDAASVDSTVANWLSGFGIE